jgi:hypothetical protein
MLFSQANMQSPDHVFTINRTATTFWNYVRQIYTSSRFKSRHNDPGLVMVNGMKTAIPIDALPVYSFSEAGLTGGTANEFAEQVISAQVKTLKLPNNALSLLMAHQADGQYQARMFYQTLKSSVQGDNEEDLPDGHDIFFVIPWDTAHWMDLCMVDIMVLHQKSKPIQYDVWQRKGPC